VKDESGIFLAEGLKWFHQDCILVLQKWIDINEMSVWEKGYYIFDCFGREKHEGMGRRIERE